MATKSTCIIPKPDHIGPIDFGDSLKQSQPEVWLSEFGNIVRIVHFDAKLFIVLFLFINYLFIYSIYLQMKTK